MKKINTWLSDFFKYRVTFFLSSIKYCLSFNLIIRSSNSTFGSNIGLCSFVLQQVFWSRQVLGGDKLFLFYFTLFYYALLSAPCRLSRDLMVCLSPLLVICYVGGLTAFYPAQHKCRVLKGKTQRHHLMRGFSFLGDWLLFDPDQLYPWVRKKTSATANFVAKRQVTVA